MVEIKDKKQYFELIKDFEYIPFTQTEGWCNLHACYKPENIRFFVDNINCPNIALFAHQKSVFGIKLLIIEGESFKTNILNHKAITGFYQSLQNIDVHILEINSSHIYNPLFEIGVRRAGYLRPVGFFSSAFSYEVKLGSAEVEFDKVWAKNIRKAERHTQSFDFNSTISESQMNLFSELYNDLLQRKKFNDHLSYPQLSQIINNEDFGYATMKNENGNILSAVVFFKRNNFSISILSITTPEGREKSSGYIIYKYLYKHLSDLGFQTFDMGRLSPSNHSKDNLFVFKSGVIGQYVIYNGEWSWYKYSLLRPLMYFVKRFLFHKIEV